MVLSERVRGFGKRRDPRPAVDGGFEPLKATSVTLSLRGAVWDGEDYLARDDAPVDLEDHWAPAAALVTANGGGGAVVKDDLRAVVPDPPNAPVVVDSQTVPVQLRSSFDDFSDLDAVAKVSAAEWSESDEPDLPFFDPSATAAPVVADVFAGRHTWRVGTRARLLALATAIPHVQGRELAARVFENALAEARWPNFFRSWLRLAPSLGCPRVIALAVELKEHWDDSPHLWRFRDSPGRPSRQHESARGQLGWRRALAMAEARTHEPVWRILDDDLIADWEELGEPCPGFWSLAEWLEVMCSGDEAEIHSLGLVAAHGRDRRALHLQDMCERLGLGKTGAVDGSGRMPMVDQDVSTFPFRNGHFRPGASVALIERRAPTEEEMRVREVE